MLHPLHKYFKTSKRLGALYERQMVKMMVSDMRKKFVMTGHRKSAEELFDLVVQEYRDNGTFYAYAGNRRTGFSADSIKKEVIRKSKLDQYKR